MYEIGDTEAGFLFVITNVRTIRPNKSLVLPNAFHRYGYLVTDRETVVMIVSSGIFTYLSH